MSVHWTIEIPDNVAEKVAAVAAERGVAPEALLGQDAVERYTVRRRKLGIVSLGRSGHTDTARRHEEIIRDAFAGKTARDA